MSKIAPRPIATRTRCGSYWLVGLAQTESAPCLQLRSLRFVTRLQIDLERYPSMPLRSQTFRLVSSFYKRTVERDGPKGLRSCTQLREQLETFCPRDAMLVANCLHTLRWHARIAVGRAVRDGSRKFRARLEIAIDCTSATGSGMLRERDLDCTDRGDCLCRLCLLVLDEFSQECLHLLICFCGSDLGEFVGIACRID